jgi:DNA-binding HxlR family transcriptional regulator
MRLEENDETRKMDDICSKILHLHSILGSKWSLYIINNASNHHFEFVSLAGTRCQYIDSAIAV